MKANRKLTDTERSCYGKTKPKQKTLNIYKHEGRGFRHEF
jgi:hypothetical protein